MGFSYRSPVCSARGKLFVDFEIPPKILGVFVVPIERLPKGDEKFLAKEIEDRECQFQRGSIGSLCLPGFLLTFGGPSPSRIFYRDANFEPCRQSRFEAQDHGQYGVAADSFSLFSIKIGLVRAARTAVLGGVNIQKPLHHFLAIECGQKECCRFPRSDHQFSGSVLHRELLAVRECLKRRNWKRIPATKEEMA